VVGRTAIRLLTTALPIVAIAILLGWGLSWWISIAALAYYLIALVPTYAYIRRVRRRYADDPIGWEAYANRARHRIMRWGKVYGLLSVAMLLALLIFAVVLAAFGGQF
jgi:hypothetical protein